MSYCEVLKVVTADFSRAHALIPFSWALAQMAVQHTIACRLLKAI